LTMSASSIIDLARCKLTGRLWVNIGSGLFAIGFGPKRFVERVWWRKQMVYPRKLEL
jgi:predicted lipoprotein